MTLRGVTALLVLNIIPWDKNVKFVLNFVQGSTIRLFPGLVNFVPADTYHLCLKLPAAFLQPGNGLIVKPCMVNGQGRSDHRQRFAPPPQGITLWLPPADRPRPPRTFMSYVPPLLTMQKPPFPSTVFAFLFVFGRARGMYRVDVQSEGGIWCCTTTNMQRGC